MEAGWSGREGMEANGLKSGRSGGGAMEQVLKNSLEAGTAVIADVFDEIDRLPLVFKSI